VVEYGASADAVLSRRTTCPPRVGEITTADGKKIALEAFGMYCSKRVVERRGSQ
jgi:hypothetical protein